MKSKYKKGMVGKLSNERWGSAFHIKILGKSKNKIGFYDIYYKEYGNQYSDNDEGTTYYSEANLDEFFTEYTKLEKAML